MSKSAALYDKALNLMPGGCSRNTVLRKPHPLYAAKGVGCRVTDVEGVTRVDFANNMASLIHGHAHPAITEAVTRQLSLGTAFTLATEAELEYAEHLLGRNPNFEQLRFVNSGTEAVMSCLKAARAYTGRPKIAKVEGAYHGLYDYAEVSQTASPANWGDKSHPHSVPVASGTPQSALDDVVIIPFNDLQTALAILTEHQNDIACILVDLLPHRVGLIPADDEFIKGLRAWCDQHGALLVFDEVITFRGNVGGAQQNYAIAPDLTAMGKMIGGGFPVGALAGRRDVMQVMNPLSSQMKFPHSGTFSANPITMVAGKTAMELYDKAAVDRLNDMNIRLIGQINQAISVADIPASVSGGGSMFRVHLKPDLPNNYRETYSDATESGIRNQLLDHMFDNGIMMINTCSGTLSTAMEQRELDQFCDVLLQGFYKIKPLLDNPVKEYPNV